jgi:glycosyltransferase involved in cell wall biosynthesis
MQKARRLIARGHEVTILAPASEDEMYAVGNVVTIYSPTRDSLGVIRRGLSHYRRKFMRWDWLYYEYYLASVRRAIRRMEKLPDAVLVFNDLITPRHVKRLLPRANVLCMLSNECNTNQKDIRKTIAATHKFVCVSRYIENWTVTRYGIPPEKIMTIPNGADPESFQPRSSYLSSASPVKVLYIGRIDPNKGPDLAADAVARLRNEGVSVALTVAGGLWFSNNGNDSDDPYLQTLRQKMTAAGAEYLGHVARRDVPQLVRKHDVACILSRSNDPMPQTALEAMASGLAVLASDRGGIPEACEGAGWLVNPDDFESIVGALRTLATIPPVLNEYKRRSVLRASRATWDVNVDELEKVLTN